MATEWISPTWRMPEESNQSKFENYSLDFDGTQYIDCGTSTAIASASSFSISAWVKIDTAGGTFFSSGTSNTDRTFLFIDASTVNFGVKTGSGGVISWANSFTSVWHHIVGVVDAGTSYLYVDGVQKATGSVSTLSATAGNNVKIGNTTSPMSASPFDGQITEVSIFDYALTDGTGGTQDQIGDLYNSGTPQNTMAISGKSPVAYYPLGGSSTGSASTLTIPNESVPSATVFNFKRINSSVNGRVYAPTSTSFNDKISVSGWIRIDTTSSSNYQFIIAQDDYSSNRCWSLGLNSAANSQLWYVIYNADGTANSDTNFSGTGIKDGNWHHVALIYDGTSNANGIKLFLDGKLEAQNTASSTGIFSSTVQIGIGNSSTSSQQVPLFNSDLSNIQIWDTDLTYGTVASKGDTAGGQVAELYNNGVPLLTGTQPEAANLKAWYKLNVDTSTWNGSDWVIGEAQANYSSALSTNIGATTLTDYIDLTSGFTTGGASDNSISFWFKTTQGGGDNAILGAASSRYITVHWGYLYSNSSSSDGFRMYSSSTINDGAWHHAVYTYNQTSGAWKLYIDGDLSNSVTAATGQPVFPISRFGGYYNATYYYDGSISNVAYYNVELESSQVSTLYNNGTPEQSISYSPISWWKLNNLTTGIQDSVGSNNGTNTGVTVTDIQVSTLNGTSSGMTTANLVTSDLTRSIPYSSYSMEFDAASQNYITLPSPTIFTDFSLSFWYKQDGAAGSFETVVGRDTIDGGILTSIAFTSGVLSFKNRPGSWTALTTTSASNTEFKYYSVTYDSTANELKGYCNGILEVTTTPVFSSATGSEQSFNRIGRYGSTYYLDGQLSNLATFTSILSEDQVLTIYNGGVPNDISSLSPVNWWSLAGDSYYDGTNWICPDLGSANNNGTSVNMAGTELVGNGPGSTANGIATSMDIPANLKGNAPNSSKNAFSVNMNSADRVADVPA